MDHRNSCDWTWVSRERALVHIPYESENYYWLTIDLVPMCGLALNFGVLLRPPAIAEVQIQMLYFTTQTINFLQFCLEFFADLILSAVQMRQAHCTEIVRHRDTETQLVQIMTTIGRDFDLRSLSIWQEFDWWYEIALLFLVKSTAIVVEIAIDRSQNLN